jgi:hypothetical protein
MGGRTCRVSGGAGVLAGFVPPKTPKLDGASVSRAGSRVRVGELAAAVGEEGGKTTPFGSLGFASAGAFTPSAAGAFAAGAPGSLAPSAAVGLAAVGTAGAADSFAAGAAGGVAGSGAGLAAPERIGGGGGRADERGDFGSSVTGDSARYGEYAS